jgi:hypothetical protein
VFFFLESIIHSEKDAFNKQSTKRLMRWRFPAFLCLSIEPCATSFLFVSNPFKQSIIMIEERQDRQDEQEDPEASLPVQQQQEEAAAASIISTGAALDVEDVAALEFCRLIGRLKITPRTGWVRREVPGYESVADHRYAHNFIVVSKASPTL